MRPLDVARTLTLLSIALTSGCAKPNSLAAPPQPLSREPAPSTPPAVEVPTARRTLDKRALLIGINDYRHDFPDLQGSVRDAENIRDVLVRQYGFPAQQVEILQNGEATLSAIRERFEQHLIANAKRDTVALFYFSGHGSQIVDLDGDEPDGLDETLVAHDSGREPHENRDLRDDELNGLLARLSEKSEHVTVILDSCHSGTAARALGARAVPADLRGAPRESRPPVPTLPDGAAQALSYTLISGARADEFAYERRIEGAPNGALTWHLARALRSAPAHATIRDVMDRVKSDVTALFPSQHPQLEGEGQEALWFGVEQRASASSTLVVRRGTRLELQAGRAHGVTEGSLYALLDSATEPARELMRASVGELHDLTAELLPVASSETLPEVARAVELSHRHVGERLGVLIRQLPAAERARLRAALRGSTLAREVDELDAADLILEGEPRGGLRLSARAGEPLGTTIAPGPRSAEQAVERVNAWGRWAALRRLDNPAGDDLPLTLELPKSRGLLAPAQISGSVRAGDSYDLTLSNGSEHAFYVNVLVLSGDGSVALVYPPAGASESLAPGESFTKRFRACLPRAWSGPLRDTLKVMFTRTPTDFGFLRQAALATTPSPDQARSVSIDPLRTLLESAAGVRGARFVDVPPSDWAVRQQTIEIVPQAGAESCD